VISVSFSTKLLKMSIV